MLSLNKRLLSTLMLPALLLSGPLSVVAGELNGRVVDAQSGKPIASRVYVQNLQTREWHFVEAASANGSALPYREQWVKMPNSVERHTTVSAHPFHVSLPPGVYQVTIERGKEYRSLRRDVIVPKGSAKQTEVFRLRRWINMADLGWYSGETHVHRRHHELPNVMLAEDLNVAFPVTYWTIQAYQAPTLAPSPLRRPLSPFGKRKDPGVPLVVIDDTHVMFPRNTEYEIFSIGTKRHVLGAMFILNHKTVFQRGMPPVKQIAEQAHREGALLDLDKHSWPWSMMLIPIAKVDLYELANNSVWRTEFGFRRTSVPIPDYMKIEQNKDGMTERGWLDFGFQNYYALLNCGFRLRPTAGTASGVHPVPLGYSRVYVHSPRGFKPQRFIDGLREGRSFVTNGPMLFCRVGDAGVGEEREVPGPVRRKLVGRVVSDKRVERVEVIVNGMVTKQLQLQPRVTREGAFFATFTGEVEMKESSWIAVRCFEAQGKGRVRFAHTSPIYFTLADKPLRPRRVEIDYLLSRVQRQIDRNKEVLRPEAMAEFREALEIYQKIAKRARD